MSELQRQACDFLWFGFVPDMSSAVSEAGRLSGLLRDDSVETFDWRFPREAKDLLVQVISEILEDDAPFVVPVSAGLDSRGILGAVLELHEASQIRTYTWGHKGADDFDRVKFLIGSTGVRHELIDLQTHSADSWNTQILVDRVSQRPRGVVLGVGETGGGRLGTLGRSEPRPLSLSGYLGDSISGKKLNSPPDSTWEGAIDFFIGRNRPYKGRLNVFPDWYNPRDSLPERPLIETGISFNDQLDWGYRQRQRIGPSVGAYAGDHRKHPYADPRWWRSFMLTPLALRREQRFYKDFLAQSFPRVFPDLQSRQKTRPSLIKKTWSHIHGKFRPRVNPFHVDMDLFLGTDPLFRKFCFENIKDLNRRGLLNWLDLDVVLGEISRNPSDLGRLAYSLASLEINLKAGQLTGSTEET